MWRFIRERQISTLTLLLGIFIALLGLALAVGGGWLIALGGSPYYLIAGLGLVSTGFFIALGRREGLWLYALVFLGTVFWALLEVQLDPWKLMPRLLAPAGLGLALLSRSVRTRLVWSPIAIRRDQSSSRGNYFDFIFIAVLAVIAGFTLARGPATDLYAAESTSLKAQDNDEAADWKHNGRTPAGDRYSPLDQITPQNVQRLQLAWTLRTGDLPRADEQGSEREFNFEVTPLKVGDTVYLCTPHSWVIAVDAGSGKQRWKFDPQADTRASSYSACRGVAYYEAPEGTPCRQRILATSADARLFALDANSGALCEDFGDHGFVSLGQSLGQATADSRVVTSPLLIVKDRAILGSWVHDGQNLSALAGVVRAFDARSGKLSWAWDLARPYSANESGTRTRPDVWGAYTADAELGLVYVPDEEYSGAIVALNIETGEERWRFQSTRHEAGDLDLPAAPSLVNLQTSEGVVPALVQTTKSGQLFMLDRRDGHPLAEAAEHSASQTGGESLAKPQSSSAGLPSLAPASRREQDMWGVTPLDQLWCRIQYRKLRDAGELTHGAGASPAVANVIDWYGASIDPNRQWLLANTSYVPSTLQPQKGARQAGVTQSLLNPLQVPCNAPPWGLLTAIDLRSHQIVWQRPLGTTRDTGPLGLHINVPLPTGIFNVGASITTKSGLIFVGATADQYLRAFDVRTGQELWKTRLPAGGQATPMTYFSEKTKQQYVVITAGGNDGLRTRHGDYLMAYALPAGE